MSQENVEVVQAIFKAWNAGDMDTFRELHDPDIIMRMPEDFPEPGPFVGREAIRQFEQMRETWEADDLESISDFIDAGERVVVRFVWSGVGRACQGEQAGEDGARRKRDRGPLVVIRPSGSGRFHP